jgi:hypothetical protein
MEGRSQEERRKRETEKGCSVVITSTLPYTTWNPLIKNEMGGTFKATSRVTVSSEKYPLST